MEHRKIHKYSGSNVLETVAVNGFKPTLTLVLLVKMWFGNYSLM